MNKELSKYIDHTLLKADALPGDVERLCVEAMNHGFASVCINPGYAALAAKFLTGSPVKTCVVVGFPLGASHPLLKAAETKQAVADGAQEIDMVMNIGQMRAGNHPQVLEDIRGVVEAAGGALVKVILENCYLSEEEILKACRLCEEGGAHFVKTSTGFGPSGATVKDVTLMKKTVPALGVKAAGGIRDKKTALAMIEAGADRLGASAGIAIIGADKNASNGSSY